jgi:hypothetical protein
MPYHPRSYVISYSAPSHMCLLYTQFGKRGPRYLQGRCDLSRAELGMTQLQSAWRSHEIACDIIIIEKLGPNGVYQRSSKRYSACVRAG